MNESVRPVRLFAPLLALMLGACAGEASEAPPLQGATMGGPFALTGEDGRRVSDRDFAGRYRLVYFGFTFCPDVCPTDMAVLGAGLRRFEAEAPERAARVQPLFITVDPARDTPEVLGRFTDAFHPRFLGLTGTESEIAQAARTFRIYYERGEPAPGGGYNVNHSQSAVLYGPAGEPIAPIPIDEGAEGVAAALERWAR